MITNIRKKKSPNPWRLSPKYNSRRSHRSPLPCISPGRVTGTVSKAVFTLLLGILLVLGQSPLFSARAAPSAGSIRSYIQNGGYALQAPDGLLEGFNTDKPFIPASTIKLITCLAALNILGPDYRFQTRFFLDKHGSLVIKGGGDPTFTSENAADVARELAKQGLKQITSLVLDGSVFALEHGVDGSDHSARPYDAEIGPLAVNFNALSILVHTDGRIDSGEEQTPFLPMMQWIAIDMPPGLYRVNVGAFPMEGTLSNELRYTQELFTALLRKQGIKVGSTVSIGRVRPSASLLLTHESDTLREIIKECLEYSNNFIANELFLACGLKRFGPPATWAKARMAAKEFIEQTLHPAPGTITMVEGSGLSRKNRITPRMMLKVLTDLTPYADLLPVRHDLLLKSGTLKGVYCYGGYLQDQGRTAPFTIMLNQEKNSRDPILQILERYFKKTASHHATVR